MNLPEKIRLHLTRWTAMITLCFLGSLAWAQDQGIDVDLDVDEGGEWYANPIVWVVAGAFFILLLVALLRGGGSKE